ncbi:hypothetical protein BDF21DRAFT_18209 [Thamnidium elegans]|nr:hypothetical protein BDF21DRAFT_18209 [Thamnidium elegans]
MVSAIKRCNFTNLELQTSEDNTNHCLLFKSESTTKTGAIAEEVGELDIVILTDRQSSDIRQPGHLTPDVCLTLKPLGNYINFVKGLSHLLESIVISASANGEFRLDYAGLNVFAEHVGTKLQRPELDVDVPLPEDMDQLFKVRVRSKHLVNVLSCEELNVQDTFVSITDEAQIVFFIFFTLGGSTRSSLTVHVPLFIE